MERMCRKRREGRCPKLTDAIIFDFIAFCFYEINFQSNPQREIKTKCYCYCYTIQHARSFWPFSRPVAIMRVLLAVLFLLIAHEGTYAKPKPKPKPKAQSPFGNVFHQQHSIRQLVSKKLLIASH